jgi:hypothetical protein
VFGLPVTARSLTVAALTGAALHPEFFMNNPG